MPDEPTNTPEEQAQPAYASAADVAGLRSTVTDLNASVRKLSAQLDAARAEVAALTRIEVRHVPEPEETFDPSAHDVADPKTGFVDVGAMVDGVFVVLARRKAAGLFADIERARQSQPDPDRPQE
jgi:hypothetical protein